MKFAHQSSDLPSRKRCKVRHSETFRRARCKLAKEHTGNHWFGFYHGINLDLTPPYHVSDPERISLGNSKQEFYN